MPNTQPLSTDDYDNDLHAAWRHQLLELCKSYRFAADFDDVRDAWRDLTQHIDAQPASMTAMTAPDLQQDLQTTADALAEAYTENGRLMDELRGWKMRSLGAEDERDTLLEMNGKQAQTIVSLREALKTIYPYIKDKRVRGRKRPDGTILNLNIGEVIRDALEVQP